MAEKKEKTEKRMRKALDAAAKRIEKTKADVMKEMERNRYDLLQKYPFIGSVLMHLELIPTFGDPEIPTAATDGRRIYADCDFYTSLKRGERLFVLAHEVWHCILLHFNRRMERDPFYFNVASDLEIHFVLMDEKMQEPYVLPHDPKWRGLSAEEIYERVRKSEHRKEYDAIKSGDLKGDQAGGSGAQGDGDGSDKWRPGKGRAGFDVHLFDREGALTKAEVDAATEAIRRAIIQAAQFTERKCGRLPDHVQGLVDQIRKPQLDWRELLRQFVTSAFGDHRRWLPPARRYLSEGLYLPSRRGESLNAVLAIDTSGSTTGDLPQFFAELSGLLTSFGDYKLTVIQCDAKVQRVDEFSSETPLPSDYKWPAQGFGGTSFVPAFDYVRQNDVNPEIFIYLTDGYGPAPQNPPPYPVMWVLTHDGRENVAPWGVKLRLKPAADV